MAKKLPVYISIIAAVSMWVVGLVIYDPTTSDEVRITLVLVALACFLSGVALYVIDWRKGV